MDAAQADIHAYEAPWKALCDFALHSDLDKMNMANNPHYGQLVSQVREGGREGRKENIEYRASRQHGGGGHRKKKEFSFSVSTVTERVLSSFGVEEQFCNAFAILTSCDPCARGEGRAGAHCGIRPTTLSVGI